MTQQLAFLPALFIYFLTVIGYLKKKHTIKASFIDNSNNYIIALKIAYAVTKELTHIGELTNTESKKITLIITNDVSLKQQGHKPYIIC